MRDFAFEQGYALRVAIAFSKQPRNGRIKMTAATQVIQKVPEHLRFAVKSQGILGALALILLATPAGAQTMSGPGKVTLLRTGWNSDSFAIETTAAQFINPAGCPTADGYISLKPAPGYETYDVAKLAFQTNTNVVVTVDTTTCVAGRPKLIGINLAH